MAARVPFEKEIDVSVGAGVKIAPDPTTIQGSTCGVRDAHVGREVICEMDPRDDIPPIRIGQADGEG